MLISRRAVEAYLDRDLDSWVWMKKLKREQLLAEIRGLRPRPVFKTEPWLHQLVCFWIGIHQPRFLYLLDMGLGKSKILLDLISYAQRERKLKRALVAAPRVINLDSWHTAILEHSELEPWLCDVEDIEEKWDRLAYPKGDITVIDYPSLHLALTVKRKSKGKKNKLVPDDKKVRHIQQTYNLLGLDESHKLGNPDSLWYELLLPVAHTMDYCYATTGTLFGKDPLMAWAQFYLVDKGETLGPNMGIFKAAFFEQRTNGYGVEFRYLRSRDRILHRMFRHRSIIYDETEVGDLPQRVTRRCYVDMAPDQREHYLRALEGLINANGQLSKLDAAWIRMRQISAGFLSWTDEHGPHTIKFQKNRKLDEVERLVDEVGNHSKVVISYEYTPSGEMICQRLKDRGVDFEWLYGGTKNPAAAKRRFLEDRNCRVFVMQSEAGGTGTDGLQKVARYLIFYESPSSPIARKQTLKRVHRSGVEGRVFIIDLVCVGSCDKGVLDNVEEGIDLYDKVARGNFTRTLFI